MRVSSFSLPARLLAVLVTLLIVFGPGSAAFAQTADDAATDASADAAATQPAQAASQQASDAGAEETEASAEDTQFEATQTQDTQVEATQTQDSQVEATQTQETDEAPPASGDTSEPQPESTADDNETGANQDGPYDSTRDGSDSENGKGDPEESSKPCAGCVGKADNKNPPGQMPNGSDPNAGYECDTNEGVGQTNPAHTGCTTVVTQPNPSIALVKTGNKTSAKVGETVTYTFTVTNTGNVALKDVVLDDNKLDWDDRQVGDGTLDPKEPVTFTGVYTVQAADVVDGKVRNDAEVTGTPVTPEGADKVKDQAWYEFTVPTDTETGTPGISLLKVASVETAKLGDVVTYKFTVENTGKVDLYNVTIDDPKLGIVDQVVPLGADNVFSPKEKVTFDASKSHTISQADVDAGKFENVATVTGFTEDNKPVTATGQDTVTVDNKAGDVGVVFDCLGFDVTSTKDISNIIIEYRVGDGPLQTVKLDGLSGLTKRVDYASVAGLPAGATILRVFVKSGNNSGDNPPYPGAGEPFVNDADCPASGAPGISLDKVASVTTAKLGDVVTYKFTVENTGKVDLYNVTIDDPKLGIVDQVVPLGADNVFSPGEKVTFDASKSHTISQADVEAGKFDNIATVTGFTEDNKEVKDTGTDSVTVTGGDDGDDDKKHTFCHETKPNSGRYNVLTTSIRAVLDQGHYGSHHHGRRDIIPPFTYQGVDYPGQNWDAAGQAFFAAGCVSAPAIELDKEASVESAEVGQFVSYTFTVTNTGNRDLYNVVINDARLGITGLPVTTTQDPVLERGATITVQAPQPYKVTAADLAAGEIENTAFVTGETRDGHKVKAQDTDVVTVTDLPANVSADFDCTSVKIESDKTLRDVTIVVTNDAGGSQTLQFGDQASPFTYVAQPGWRIQSVSVRSGSPAGPPQVLTNDAICPEGPRPSIDLDKNGPAEARVGDVITYTFAVRNTGNTTLTNVHITDPLLGTGQIAVTPSTLAPSGQANSTGTATATYTVDADNIELINGARGVRNEATVRGTPPGGGQPVTDKDTHDVLIPGLTLDKIADRTTAEVGDIINYSFVVTNNSGVRLTNVHITDPLLGGTIAVTPSTLEPGATGLAGPIAYEVTKADGKAGEVLNVAIARGTTPDGVPVEDEDETTTPVPPTVIPGEVPEIRLDKFGPDTAREGDRITYRFRVTNTGKTTLTNVHITDPLLGSGTIKVSPSTLKAGARGTAKATYIVTAADAARGRIDNTATVTGTPPNGPAVTDDDSHRTLVPTIIPEPDPDPDPDPDPEPEPDLPATGTDAPTQLLAAALALMLGMLLLRAGNATPAPATPHDANGFARRPRGGTADTQRSDARDRTRRSAQEVKRKPDRT